MESENNIRVGLFQTDIVWEDKQANLQKLEQELPFLSDSADLIILPEMFTTGFSMNGKKNSGRPRWQKYATAKRLGSKV